MGLLSRVDIRDQDYLLVLGHEVRDRMSGEDRHEVEGLGWLVVVPFPHFSKIFNGLLVVLIS